MEELLKQIVGELQDFRNEVNEKFSGVDHRFDRVDERFIEVDHRFDRVDEKFTEVDHRFDRVDEKFTEVDHRFDHLEKGQAEIKDVIRHSATLMTENLTDIRKDMRLKHQGTEADIDLLFREVEGLKRQTNKIEQRLSN